VSPGAAPAAVDDVALLAELRRTRAQGEPILLAAWRVWSGADLEQPVCDS
jgi:hypothetical protein